VTDVAWSPDGRRVASGSWDNTVQVWDANSGSTLLIYRGHSQKVVAVAWSPDGRRVASGSWDNTVQVWDANSGSTLLIYRGHSYRKHIAQLFNAWVHTVAWSPDGKRIASAGENVQVWDAENGGTVFTCRWHSRNQYGVNTVAWSPDGKHIASGNQDKTVQVWDAGNGGDVYTYQGHSDTVDTITWSPDGKRIASASENVQVWNATNGSNVYIYQRHSSRVYAVAWSPDGKRIASAGFDKTVQIWQAPLIETKAPTPPKEKPSTTSFDWGDLVSKVFDKIAGVASIIALLDVVERRWRERSTTNDAHPHQVASQPSETDIVAIRLRMTHGPDHQFEEWLTDPDKLKHYIDVFNQPATTILPLKVVFVQRNGKELSVDVLKGTQNNPQLDELLSYLNTNSEQK
jgi:WD40 repeat protein